MKIEAAPKELADFVAELQNRLTKSEIDPREVARIIDEEMEKIFTLLHRDNPEATDDKG